MDKTMTPPVEMRFSIYGIVSENYEAMFIKGGRDMMSPSSDFD